MRILIFIVVITGCMNQMTNYECLPINHLYDLIEGDSGQLMFQDEESLALVYKLSDSKAVLLPAGGNKGLLFSNIDDLRNVLATGNIPISEDYPNFLFMERKRLSNIEKEVDFFLNYMGGQIKCDVIKLMSDENGRKVISDSINSYVNGKNEISDKLIVSLGIYAGELIRIEKNAKWEVEKRYSYNVYYEPFLTTENTKYFPWYKLYDLLKRKGGFEFNYYYSTVSIGFEF